MQKLLLILIPATAIELTFASAAYSQDELPAAAPASQPAAGQPAAAPAQNDAVYRQQVSYALGRNFAENLRDGEIDLDLKALVAGISDVLSGAKPKWTDEQLQPTMQRFSREMEQKAVTRMKRLATKNKQEADAFLAQNAKREGVQTTPSGLQYRVLQEADGPSPTLNDTIRCNYRGTLLNGTEFDNSANHGGPAEFTIAPGLIPGWIEALQKMRVGEKWQLFVPPNLAYELEPPGPPIEPNSMLVFEIELLEIVPQ
ncbi:MAG: FKBP-type peptidyl-prolyl cis-trans isomerase [Planctomycetes bacterium]|nr:FKBP-type peptidyl-prolyl cis-trans isomerase [Planctomycetota bacterium]